MKFLHLSDLHIGKKLNGFSLLEDQKYILEQILDIACLHKPEGVIIAGDIYDSSMPPTEAVLLLDWFLTRLLSLKTQVFIITGNHDSPERLSFCSDILKDKGLHIAALYDGTLHRVALTDEYGVLNVYMLPFIRPEQVRAIHGKNAALTHNDAVRLIIENTPLNNEERNIIIAHQFVTKQGVSPLISDSETISAGGLDNVDASMFDGFDYAAFGHLHAPQHVGREAALYGGSPLKYSLSERFHKKSVALATLLQKGSVCTERILLTPLRDVRQLKGPLNILLEGEISEDYISVILTDKTRHLEPYKKLRAVYKNCVSVAYENEIDLGHEQIPYADGLAQKNYAQIFEDFYLEQNDEELDTFSKGYIVELFEGEKF